MASGRTLTQKLKEAGLHSLIYGFGSALQSLVGFIFIPLYTKYYTPEIYGTFSLISISGTFAATVFSFGAPSSLARSYFDYSSEEERKKVVSTSLLIGFSGLLILSLLSWMVAPVLSVKLFSDARYAPHLILTGVSSGLSIINNCLYIVLRYKRRSLMVTGINLFSILIQSALIFEFLVALNWGVLSPIVGGLMAQSSQLILLLFVARRDLSLRILPKELGVQLKFGLQAILIGIGMYSLDWTNRFLIKKFCSLHDVGIYTLAYQLGSVINIALILPFSLIWAPMRMEYLKDEDSSNFFCLITDYYAFIGLSLTVFVTLFAPELLALISSRQEYTQAYFLIPFVMLGLLLYGAINIVDIGIYAARKPFYIAIIYWLAGLLNAGLASILFPRWGYLSAGLLLVFSNTFMLVAVTGLSKRYYPLTFNWKRLISQICLFCVTLYSGYQVTSSGTVAIFLKLGLIFGYFVMSYRMVLSDIEKQQLRSTLSSFLLFLRIRSATKTN